MKSIQLPNVEAAVTRILQSRPDGRVPPQLSGERCRLSSLQRREENEEFL